LNAAALLADLLDIRRSRDTPPEDDPMRQAHRMSRRAVVTGLAAGTGALALGGPAVVGQARPRVVVVGGGAGGGTAARYVAKDSAGAIHVTLVEPNRRFVTCFHANLDLGGYKTIEDLSHGYEALAQANGITMMHDSASVIDRDARVVRLLSGQR
jgi:sulfide dehydrogenase [flavocytochrome c] flavoprotein chain